MVPQKSKQSIKWRGHEFENIEAVRAEVERLKNDFKHCKDEGQSGKICLFATKKEDGSVEVKRIPCPKL